MRQHQLMWEPVLPLGGRPLLTRLAVEQEGDNGAALLTRLVVDRVEAEDGVYDVLHLGTGEGAGLRASRGEGLPVAAGGDTHTHTHLNLKNGDMADLWLTCD